MGSLIYMYGPGFFLMDCVSNLMVDFQWLMGAIATISGNMELRPGI